MAKIKTTETRVCPRCGRAYVSKPALSRADNKTLICPDCGTREALESIGIEPAEQNEIIAAIHRTERKWGGKPFKTEELEKLWEVQG